MNKNTLQHQHVALLKGGLSSEREVSLSSAKGVKEALDALGHTVTEIDAGRDVSAKLVAAAPDVVFNALHGTYGEDGCVQGVCEILGIPYTHSGVRASALAMDKALSKTLLGVYGVVSPKAQVMSQEMVKSVTINGPVVIKPVRDGSSVGMAILQDGETFTPSDDVVNAAEEFLVEEYIAGKELTVAVLNGEPLGMIEIRPKTGFYDYKNKYETGNTEYIFPPEIPDDVVELANAYAKIAHEKIGCRGISRSDFRYDDTKGLSPKDALFFLEINTHPGMTPLSLVPKIAKNAGIPFKELVQILLDGAKVDNAK